MDMRMLKMPSEVRYRGPKEPGPGEAPEPKDLSTGPQCAASWGQWKECLGWSQVGLRSCSLLPRPLFSHLLNGHEKEEPHKLRMEHINYIGVSS